MKSSQNPRPIAPDDPRHGTNQGYNAGCHEYCCRQAHKVYKQLNLLGRTRRYVDATGTRRRLEALAALGYSMADISARLGCTRTYVYQLRKSTQVRSDNAVAVATLYDRLCMTLPDHPLAVRARRHAAKQGWLPPLAWDDIDNDPAPADSSFDEPVVDEVRVQRVLSGVMADCNTAERYAVIAAWKGSHSELERLTGWNIHRMIRQQEVA